MINMLFVLYSVTSQNFDQNLDQDYCVVLVSYIQWLVKFKLDDGRTVILLYNLCMKSARDVGAVLLCQNPKQFSHFDLYST